MSTELPPLRTRRLLIRPVSADDESACRRTLAPGDAPGFERWMRWVQLNHEVLADLDQPPYGERAIELLVTGEVVGLVGLVPLLAPFGQIDGAGAEAPFTCEVGLYWALDPTHRGHGYATEAADALARAALDRLRLRRIVATTEVGNAASQAVMRRIGMRVVPTGCADPPWFQVVGVLDAPSPKRRR
jgi:RimJ/RimL family protein N-acetyltransferase